MVTPGDVGKRIKNNDYGIGYLFRYIYEDVVGEYIEVIRLAEFPNDVLKSYPENWEVVGEENEMGIKE